MEATVIKRSVTTTAPRERVWKSITNPKNLTKWMTETRFANLAVGEKITFPDGENTSYGSIAVVEPPERFAYRWQIHPDHPAQTLVTFHLEALADGTRITVTEEGFEALPEEFQKPRLEDNIRGWEMTLEAIIEDVESEGDMDTNTASNAITRSVTVSAPRERVWNTITRAQNMNKWFAPLDIKFDKLAEGEKMIFTHEGKTTYGAIATVEPTGRFAFRWQAHPDHEIFNLVTFNLEEVDEGTKITVTEEGFDALPADVRQKQFTDNVQGWGIVLDGIVKTLNETA